MIHRFHTVELIFLFFLVLLAHCTVLFTTKLALCLFLCVTSLFNPIRPGGGGVGGGGAETSLNCSTLIRKFFLNLKVLTLLTSL